MLHVLCILLTEASVSQVSSYVAVGITMRLAKPTVWMK